MSEPTVCAILLTRDRPELAAKAVECFRRQTYQNKILVIWDTSFLPFVLDPSGDHLQRIWVQFASDGSGQTGRGSIGWLRNEALYWCMRGTGPYQDIFIHWDDDDWSHPNRIAEQVALLQASGADVVGYNEMLFWRDLQEFDPERDEYLKPEEAWLFQCAKQLTPALGSSLCYWRKTWERTKFADLPKAPGGMSEYRDFLRNNKVETVSSLGALPITFPPSVVPAEHDSYTEPRMIARIHGANFMPYNIEEQIERGSNAMPNEGWHRVPEWDNRVREILS